MGSSLNPVSVRPTVSFSLPLDLPEGEYIAGMALESAARSRRVRLSPFCGLHLTSLQQLSGQIDGGLNWQRIILPVARSVEGIRILTPFFDSGVIALALSLTASLKYRDGNTKFLLRYLLKKHIGRILTKKPAAASPVAIWRLHVIAQRAFAGPVHPFSRITTASPAATRFLSVGW